MLFRNQSRFSKIDYEYVHTQMKYNIIGYICCILFCRTFPPAKYAGPEPENESPTPKRIKKGTVLFVHVYFLYFCHFYNITINRLLENKFWLHLLLESFLVFTCSLPVK